MTTEQTTDGAETPVRPANPAWAYQHYFGPAIFEPLADHVVTAAPPHKGQQALDLACGTGILTRRVAPLAGSDGRVVGVDLNPAMIEVARSIDAPGGAPIEYHQGDATDLDLPGDSFDLCTCQQGLQFLPDRAAGVASMRRAVRDGGRAVVAVWRDLDHHPFFAALAAAEEPHLVELAGVSAAGLTAPFSLGDPEELEALLRDGGFDSVELVAASVQAGFRDADHFVERVEYAYTAVVPAFAEDPVRFEEYLARIITDTEELVTPYRSGDQVVLPMHATIAVAS
jgi:ubiquinone/menaquinone biosynthesis C-methylase UbiE